MLGVDFYILTDLEDRNKIFEHNEVIELMKISTSWVQRFKKNISPVIIFSKVLRVWKLPLRTSSGLIQARFEDFIFNAESATQCIYVDEALFWIQNFKRNQLFFGKL